MFNNDSKFDIDLKYGIIAEKKLSDIFLNKKVEVKTDCFIDKTGNIGIEWHCWGKPSGISVTQADYWFIFLGNANSEIGVVIKTDALKELARKFYLDGCSKDGGNQNKSKFILVPWKEIINLSNYGKEQTRWNEDREIQKRKVLPEQPGSSKEEGSL